MVCLENIRLVGLEPASEARVLTTRRVLTTSCRLSRLAVEMPILHAIRYTWAQDPQNVPGKNTVPTGGELE